MYSVYQPWDPLKVCVVGRSYSPEFYEFMENSRLRELFQRIARETEEDFQEMCDFVQEMKFDRLGIFTYSHEENTHSYSYEDDVPDEVKQERANHVMQIQEQISYDLNQAKIGKTFKTLIDRKESGQFVGRTEFDSPEVDNEVIIDASKHYVRIGDFVDVKITDATEFDLHGEPV